MPKRLTCHIREPACPKSAQGTCAAKHARQPIGRRQHVGQMGRGASDADRLGSDSPRTPAGFTVEPGNGVPTRWSRPAGWQGHRETNGDPVARRRDSRPEIATSGVPARAGTCG